MAAVTKKHLMVRLLANKFEKDQGAVLFQLLSEPEKTSLEAIETSCQEPEILMAHPALVLKEQHYSWIAGPLSTFPSPLKELILRALPSGIRELVAKLLQVSASKKPLSLPVRRHLLYLLWEKIGLEQSPSLLLLEPTDFDFLLKKSKKELVLIAEFLGIQEIAESLRKTVDKKIVQKVLNALDESAKRYLLLCLSRSKKAHLTQKIALEKWDGSSESLRKLIILRGMKKLGIALSGQNPAFLKRLARKFDIGRGSLLKKNLHEKAIPTATDIFAEEVKNINGLITSNKRAS